MEDRRFIEETFPVRGVSAESSREKSIRHGHISTLHIWWARRPLASSRAINYAALIPAPGDTGQWKQIREFITNFSKWENSLTQKLIKKAREDILGANGGQPPKVLDPFAGGGAIPLEALRLGCDVHSSDYNPVATLIQKCTLEYPQKYGTTGLGSDDWTGLRQTSEKNPLVEDIKKWGNWVLSGAKKEIGRYYPDNPDGSVPVGYLWARTIPCQNPVCGEEIPLVRQFWLAKKSNKRVALFPFVEEGRVKFKVVGEGYEKWPSNFDPKKGTVSRAIATCIVCGSVVEGDTTRRLFQEGKAGERMIAVVSHQRGVKGKTYRIATSEDVRIFSETEKHLERKRLELAKRWGLDPVPDEPTPEGKGRGAERAFSVRNYGLVTWGDLFNSRQRLALITFCGKVRQVYEEMIGEGGEEEYAKAVTTYLGIAVDRLANQCCSIARWNNVGEKIEGAFSRQALQMIWDYIELNPSSQATGDWNSALTWVWKVVEHASQVSSVPAIVTQGSATSLPYPDNEFDAILTDPPYYDNVPYSHLSDFFYVWLKRSVGALHLELFSTPLTPKSSEIVAYSNREGGWEAGKRFFEDMLKRSFQEIHRVLKPNGIAVIVYAHKSTAGWETLINSLLDSNLIMTGAWPLHTERKARMRARESAALASSIYIVARKMQREPTGFYSEVKEELRKHLDQKLERLWQEGIAGADFFIAAIGSAIEVFGRYEKVMDYEGNVIRADRLLDDVREIATDYAVRQILHNGFGGDISDLTRLYVLWRWEFGEARVPFDDARKLAQSCGVDLSVEWNRDGFIRKEKEFIRLLSPHERNIEKLADSHDLIDILHLALLHWEKGKRDDMAQVISDSGFGQSEAFYRVAQAVSETLPNESKEKKLLDGFLVGRERVREEVRERTVQTRLM